MPNLNISVTIDSKQAESELKKFQGMISGIVKNFERLRKGLGFGDETIKEAQKLNKSIQNIEANVKQVTQTTADLSKVAKEGFTGLRQEVEKTQKGFIGLQYSLKSILTDAMTLMNFQLRWYAARTVVFGVPRAIKAGIGFEAEIDRAQAMLLRYSAMEGQVRDIHRQVAEEITTYARQLAINLPVTFEEIIKSADRLLAAGVNIDTVKGSLESFAKLQVAFPEIEPEKFTTAIIGFLNTFRRTPGLKEFENDAQRLQVILDKVTVALAVGVIAPRDINVVIQHLGQMSQAAGFSIDQMLALSVMVTNLGAKAGPAGRALRGLIDSLASTKGIENLEKIGVQLDKSRTVAEQFKTVIEGLRKAVGTGEAGLTLGAMEFLRGIAPTERRSALIALIRELETYQNLVDSISKSQGALDRTSAVMSDTLDSQWKIFKSLTKEMGAAITNSELLKDSLKFLIDVLKALGFWLSGIVGIFSLAVDGLKWLYHSVMQVLNPLERAINALLYLTTGDAKGALAELKRLPEVYYFHEEKAREALRGSLERAAKETKTIQDVLFGKAKFTGGKDTLGALTSLGDKLSELPSDEAKRKLELLTEAMERWRATIEALDPDLDSFSKKVKSLWDEADKLRRKWGDQKWISEGLWKGLGFLTEAKVRKEHEEFVNKQIEMYKAREKLEKDLSTVNASELDKRLASARDFIVESMALNFRSATSYEEYKRREVEIFRAAEEWKKQILLEHQKAIQEAEIKHQLFIIDLAEQEFKVSKPEAIKQRLDLYKELLGIQEQHLQSLDKLKDVPAWYSQQNAIEQTHQRIIELNLSLKEYKGTFSEGLQEGFNRYIRDAQTVFQHGVGLATQAAQAMQQAFSDFFFDAMQLKLKTLHDYVMSFLTSIQRAIANMLAQQFATSFMNLLFPTGPTTSQYFGAQAKMARQYGGPVSAGHPYLVGERGPELFVPKSSGTVVPKISSPNVEVSINVENKTGLPVQARQTDMYWDESSKRWVKNVVLELASTDPAFRSAMNVRR